MRSLVAAAALVLLAAGCSSKGKHEAVPAEVDVEWPDAAGFPPEVDGEKPSDVRAQPPSDAGAGSGPSESSPAPSMSTGSDG